MPCRATKKPFVDPFVDSVLIWYGSSPRDMVLGLNERAKEYPVQSTMVMSHVPRNRDRRLGLSAPTDLLRNENEFKHKQARAN